MVPKDGKSLPLGTRQAIIERRELFQMASQRSGHKRQSGGVGFDEALDIPGIGRGECPPCCLRGAVRYCSSPTTSRVSANDISWFAFSCPSPTK